MVEGRSAADRGQTAPRLPRSRFDRPVARAGSRRAILLSVLLHAIGLLPVLTITVLDRAWGEPPLEVAAQCAHSLEPDPLEEHQPLEVTPPDPERRELETPAHDVEIATPLFEELRIDRSAVSVTDPMSTAGMGQRFAPRRTRPGADGAGGAGDAGEAGGTEEQTVVGPPPPPREPVVVEPVAIYEGYNPERDYPERALRYGWEGVVGLELTLDTKGNVKAARVLWTSRPIFGPAAVKISLRWRYHAKTVDGVPVQSTIRRRLTFELPGG